MNDFCFPQLYPLFDKRDSNHCRWFQKGGRGGGGSQVAGLCLFSLFLCFLIMVCFITLYLLSMWTSLFYLLISVSRFVSIILSTFSLFLSKVKTHNECIPSSFLSLFHGPRFFSKTFFSIVYAVWSKENSHKRWFFVKKYRHKNYFILFKQYPK